MSVMKLLLTVYFFHVASAYSVLAGIRQQLISENVDNNIDRSCFGKRSNVLIDCNSPHRLISVREEIMSQQLSPRRKAIMSAAVLLSSFVVLVRGPNNAFAEAEDKKNTYLNTYPGGNQLKSLKSMGGLPKRIRSICRIMVNKRA
jgi:hypothetical protein